MEVCKECQKEFDKLSSLRKHRSLVHKISSEQTYIDYKLNGHKPICKCGCGEVTNFLSFEKGFTDYILGHAARVNNNWGHNPKAIKKSHETQKRMYNSGELQIWNKGLTMEDERVRNNIDKTMANPERGKNISKRLIGVAKSEEHKNKISEHAKLRWSNQEERIEQRFRRLKYFKNRQFNKKNKLETKFENILILLNLEYESQYPLNGYLYDFYLNKFNVLIEVDGDFYHCNPQGKYPFPTYKIQEDIQINDLIKNNLAEEIGVKLLRFWESDINNKPEEVILRLKTELGVN